MKMELRHLRYLIAASDAGTLIKAAENLRLAQPALSRQISALERELGTPVFTRSRSGVSLTATGAVCLGAARRIVTRVEEAVDRVTLARAGRVGTCTIYGSTWAVLSGFLGALVSHLNSVEPGIRLIVEEAGPAGHWGGLRAGTVDISIATTPPRSFEDLVSRKLLDDVVDTAILPSSHALADRKSIRLADLKDEQFLLYDPTLLNYEDRDLNGAFARAGFKPGSTRYVGSVESLLAMVAAGMGWSLHRRSLRGRFGPIATVPIDDFTLGFPVDLVWRKGDDRPVVSTVLHHIFGLAQSKYPEMYSRTDVTHEDTYGDGTRKASIRNLEFRDLRYFVAVAEEQTIGRAAKRLEISQPALSRQVQDLERDLGVNLFERSAQGITKTAAGEVMYIDARSILDDVDSISAEVARAERTLAGECQIVTVPSPNVRDLMKRTMSRAASAFPNIELQVQTMPTPAQPGVIERGQFDLGLCLLFPGIVSGYPGIECKALLSDTINSALLPIDHPLAARDEIEFADLATIPFVFFRRDFHPPFHDYLMQVFRAHDYSPIEGPMQEGLQTMWSLTAAGSGWCLGFEVQKRDPPPGLVAVAVKGFDIPWGVGLLTRRDESRPTILAVIDMITRAAHSTRPGALSL